MPPSPVQPLPAASHRIGFMQGRLSDLVGGRIQAFPWDGWRTEFPEARRLGLVLMEWTLDDEDLERNPLLTPGGQREIRDLCRDHGLRVPSVTGDCFMQAPFWKQTDSAERSRLLGRLDRVIAAAGALGVECLVVPLVDAGSVAGRDEERALTDDLLERFDTLRRLGLKIAFESDYPPDRLARLIGGFPAAGFGINYDIGNSAALGYRVADELSAYGDRIVNIHVKDRMFQGPTVPLGSGAAKLDEAVAGLEQLGYRGNYILQTARADDADHAGVLARYAAMTAAWISAAH